MKKIIFVISALLLLNGCLFIPPLSPLDLLLKDKPAETQTKPPEQVHLSGIHNSGSIVVNIQGVSQAAQIPQASLNAQTSVEVVEPPEPVGTQEPTAPVKEGIKEDEGLSLFPYSCTPDTTTIGYGRNLTSKGITKAEAEMMFETDFTEARADLRDKIFKTEWPGLPPGIQNVLINMRYQLGPGGFRGFEKMITAIRESNWQMMTEEMKNSLWHKQTTERAESLIRVVESYIN